jgi:hypothetical protein
LFSFIQTNLSARCLAAEQFKVWFSPTEFTSASLHQNAERVAHKLAANGKSLFVAFSGGLDSEFILRTFISAGIDITPIIVDSPFNQTEVAHAYEMCAENNIIPAVISYTSKPQFVSDLYSIARRYNVGSLIGCVTMLAARYAILNDGDILTGHGDPFTMNTTYATVRTVDPTPIPKLLKFSDYDYYVETFLPELTGSFFTADAGIFYSFLSEVNHQLPYEEAKADLYGIELRSKKSWDVDFYRLNMQLLHNSPGADYYIHKDYLMSFLETYKI